jgi:hypothetical protein
MDSNQTKPIINCYIVELDEKHFNADKITARYTNTQRFSDEDTLRARRDAINMLLIKRDGAEEIRGKEEYDPDECAITVKLFLEFFFTPEMGDAEVYKPVQLLIFDDDNTHILELMEALETECEIWNQAGLTVETREIVLSDEKATVISCMLDAIYDPTDLRYRKNFEEN